MIQVSSDDRCTRRFEDFDLHRGDLGRQLRRLGPEQDRDAGGVDPCALGSVGREREIAPCGEREHAESEGDEASHDCFGPSPFRAGTRGVVVHTLKRRTRRDPRIATAGCSTWTWRWSWSWSDVVVRRTENSLLRPRTSTFTTTVRPGKAGLSHAPSARSLQRWPGFGTQVARGRAMLASADGQRLVIVAVGDRPVIGIDPCGGRLSRTSDLCPS
jgi:hypothetical protein